MPRASRAPVGTRNPRSRVQPPLEDVRSKHGQSTAFYRQEAHKLLILGFSIPDIRQRVSLSRSSIYNIHHNLILYGTTTKPKLRTLGRRPKVTSADKEALYDELREHRWMYQDEMVYWLDVERGVKVDRSTIAKFMKADGISRKALQVVPDRRSEDLREDYRRRITRYSADELVFIDESIFNEKTGWRHRAYGPIGEDDRYVSNARRGKTWSILPAYTIRHGYLECTAVKEGYFNAEQLLEWLEFELLPAIERQIGRTACVVLDNCSAHCDRRVEELIRNAGHAMEYLPPYSPDFNPIELTFSVLKSWVRRNFYYRRHEFDQFGDFSRWSITASRCDRFAVKHFRHSGGGLYIEEEQLIRANEFLRAYERADMTAGDLLQWS